MASNIPSFILNPLCPGLNPPCPGLNALCPGSNPLCSCLRSLFFRFNSPPSRSYPLSCCFDFAAVCRTRMGGSRARCRCQGIAGPCNIGVSRVGKLAKGCKEDLEILLHATTTSSDVVVVVRKILEVHETAHNEERNVIVAREDLQKKEFEERSNAKFNALCEVRLHNASIYSPSP